MRVEDTAQLTAPILHRHICACGRMWTHRYAYCGAHDCPRCGEEVEVIAIDHRRMQRRAGADNFYPPPGAFT